MIEIATLAATLAGGLAKFAWKTIKEAPQEGVKGLIGQQAERVVVAALGEDRTRLAEDYIKEFRRRLSGPRKLANNHDIVKALRTAQLEAIDHIVAKFQKSAPINPPVRFLSEVRRGLYAAKADAERMKWDNNQQTAMLASFERAFTGSGVQLEAQLDGAESQAAEMAWAELLSWSNLPAPDPLRSRFFGEYGGSSSWFELYCGFVAEELKQPDSRMREAFFAGKLVEIGGLVVEGSIVLERIESRTVALQQELGAARGQLVGLAEQGLRIAAELNRRVTSGPFRSMEVILDQDDARLETSIFPRKADYRDNKVHAPAVLGQIEDALEGQRSALIVGHGASGKTTLAKILACRPRFQNCRAYYLDLASSSPDSPLGDRAVEAMAMIADPDVLFIIDNAHLDPTAAFDVWQQWKTSGRESRVLILTRRIRAALDVWDASPEVEAIDLPRFDLVIQPEDLLGVFRRLAGNGAETTLTPALLDQWLKLFGGDLMMFSVAVLGCIARRGDAQSLRPEDAHAYVRSAYFEKLHSEKSALLDLAAIAEVEGAAPVELFEQNAFKASIQRGLVWVEARGRGGRSKRYALCHPGLGAIFRDAAGSLATSGRDRIRLLRGQPAAAALVAIRLNRTGAAEEARALLEVGWSTSPWPWPAAELGLPWLLNVLRLTQELAVLDDKDLAKRAAAWVGLAPTQDELTAQALTTSLGDLKAFLSYADGAMPEVANAIWNGLAKKPGMLTAQALAAPPHFLVAFLEYASRKKPEIAHVIRGGLATHPDELAAQAMTTSLGDLKTFLTYADGAMPEVANIIWKGLAENPDKLMARALTMSPDCLADFLEHASFRKPEIAHIIRDGLATHRDELAALALTASLGYLKAFLTYADGAMPEVAHNVRDILAKHPEQLRRQALTTPIEHLGPFLAYAEAKMPEVATALIDSLTAEPGLTQWAARFVLDGPDKIVGLAQRSKAVDQVLRVVDAEAWRQRWNEKYQDRPSSFEQFARLCYRTGRTDLLGVTAGAIIRSAGSVDFALGLDTLKQLTAILVAPHDMTREEVDAFFARCIPKDWIPAQYRSRLARPGALCSALRSIALDERVYLQRHFRHPDLTKRVIASQPSNHSAASKVSDWLGLFAAAGLIDNGSTSMPRLDPGLVCAALNEWPPGPPNEAVQPIQTTVWAGFREWCRLGGQELKLDSALGEAILAQFRSAAQIGRARWAALDLVMIEWIERCQENDWWVVAEPTTLLQALRAQLGES